MEFEFVVRHCVLDRPEYLFEIDEFRRGQDPFLQAHFVVHYWSPSVFKRILSEWRVFRSIVTTPLYALGEDDDDRWRRFVSHLGFKPFTTVVCNNGQQRSLYQSKVD
jgi:hypothetical protein